MASTIYDIIIRAVDNAKGVLNGTSQQLDNLDKKTASVNSKLAGIGTTITRFGQVGAVALGGLTARAVRLADTIADTADATKISIQTIEGLRLAVDGTRINVDDISNALLRFNENLGTAASSGGKQLREALGEVKVGLKDLASLSNEEILLKVLDELSRMDDQSKAAALATDIFGRSLRGAPLEKFGADLRKAIGESAAQAKATKAAADSADVLEKALNNVSKAILIAIQPATKFVASLRPEQFDLITTAVLALAAALLTAFAASVITNIYGAITAIGALIGVLRGATIAAVTFLATTGPAGWAAIAAGVVAAGGAIYGLNKLLDQNIAKSGKAADAASGIGGDDKGKGDKPKGPARIVQPLKSEVQKVRSVLATAAESFKEANTAYDELINTFANTKDLNLQKLQFEELSRAAETLGKVVPKPTQLIERDFSLALAKNAEELRQNGIVLNNSALLQKKFANEVTSANQALEERRKRLQDATLQQSLFDNSIEDIRLTQDEQLATLAKANAAYKVGEISLSEFTKTVSSIPNELKELTVRQLEVKEAFDKGLDAQGVNDQLIAYEFQLAKASGDIRQFLEAYGKYKAIFGATAEGELKAAIDGGRKDIQTTNARKKAYEDLTTQFKNGEISARLFSIAAKDLGASESEIQRIANVHGSATDIMISNLEYLEAAADRTASAFSDSLTQAILKGQNIFKSFRDFVGNIFNDIATRLIKQSISDPIADALSGIVKGLGNNAAGGGSIFGALGDLFAGFFADGGQIATGKFGVVGEAGPEFIAGPATVTPMDGMASGGDTFNVNFSINAIDTQTGVEFLVRNKPIITQVIEQAYNKRARRGPLTVG